MAREESDKLLQRFHRTMHEFVVDEERALYEIVECLMDCSLPAMGLPKKYDLGDGFPNVVTTTQCIPMEGQGKKWTGVLQRYIGQCETLRRRARVWSLR